MQEHKRNIVYLADRECVMPDFQVLAQHPGHTYEPIRGYGHILAVFANGNCIGWITCETLGFPSVQAWMKAQGRDSV